MKIALIDVKGNDNRAINKNSSVNIRNMQELAKIVNADFIFNAYQLLNNKKQYTHIVFGFGSISSNINEVIKFSKNQKDIKNVYWLVGEYEQSMNPSLYYFCKEKKIKYTVIKNYYKQEPKKNQLKEIILNLNLLIAKKQNKLSDKKYDCIYYSRWRPGRRKYLKEYLKNDIYFSSDSKNFKQHKHIGCSPKYIKKLSWEKGKETLNLFRFSLYIEDEYTHKFYNHLANRFYEALFCNVVQFFDINCKNTIEKSGIEFNDYYYVSSYEELIFKMKVAAKDWQAHMNFQSKWNAQALQQREILCKNLKGIFENEIA